MVDDVCVLANTGLHAKSIMVLALAILGMSVGLYVLHKKGYVHYKLLPIGAVLLVSLLVPLQTRSVSAQAAPDCPPGQSDEQNSNPDSSAPLGGLVNDNPPVIEEPGLPGQFFATFPVLDNDNAPDGDPFDISTLKLIGGVNNIQLFGVWEGAGYEIYNPDDENEQWGYWEINLDCDIWNDDTMDADECPPTNSVTVRLFSNVPTGVPITIQYSVRTVSGALLAPATITVVKPAPSPITANDSGETYTIGHNCPAEPWDQNWSLDLMALISTTGSGTLLPGTIDLDEFTPGVQSSVTILNTTFTVDGNGIVTMTAPTDGDPFNYPSAGFSYQIQDTDGNYSNWADGLQIVAGSDCT